MADNDPPTATRRADLSGPGQPAPGAAGARRRRWPVPTAAVPEDIKPQLDEFGRAYATGKRKDAVARVWIKPGGGRIDVNGRESPVYFARPVLQMLISQPFVATDRLGEFDVWCTVKGGGLSGQAGAVRHGISQALIALRAGPASGAEGRGLSDPRQPRRRAQEIRQAKARRSFQFSKR